MEHHIEVTGGSVAPNIYGREIEPSKFKPQRDLLEIDPEPTGTGNVVIRIGHELPEGSYEQIGHVVLKPDEAGKFASEVSARALEGGARRDEREALP